MDNTFNELFEPGNSRTFEPGSKAAILEGFLSRISLRYFLTEDIFRYELVGKYPLWLCYTYALKRKRALDVMEKQVKDMEKRNKALGGKGRGKTVNIGSISRRKNIGLGGLPKTPLPKKRKKG